jgi:hypothetical protein
MSRECPRWADQHLGSRSSAFRVWHVFHTPRERRLPATRPNLATCERGMVPVRLPTVLFLFAWLASGGCQRPIVSTLPNPPSGTQLAQLWVDRNDRVDVFSGVGGRTLAPDPSVTYTVIAIKQGGFSRGYTVKDPDGREWSAKFPPEASAEVAASRILWAAGYHQPPVYYVPRWEADKAPLPNPQLPARFREKKPKLRGEIALDEEGTWSYYENPFVGTRELKGLLVLQAMLGNSDLKDDNNALYRLKEAVDGASVWYVARDLGHTFGRTGVIDAPRGDPAVFETTPFIKGLVNGRVKFDWRGRHDRLLEDITPADVRWICGRLQRLTDRQWSDAFRAGGYPEPDAERFIRRLKQKIAEGLALQG